MTDYAITDLSSFDVNKLNISAIVQPKDKATNTPQSNVYIKYNYPEGLSNLKFVTGELKLEKGGIAKLDSGNPFRDSNDKCFSIYLHLSTTNEEEREILVTLKKLNNYFNDNINKTSKQTLI